MVNTAPNGPESAEAAQRREALAALVARTDTPTVEAAPVVVKSGREVDCGGDHRRLLVKRFSAIGYRLPSGVYMRTKAQPGDTVLLLKSEADRLDALGVTVEPDADLEQVADEQAGGLWTDEQIKVAKAGEVVAYVGQNPDERPRVRLLEEARTGKGKGSGPRATVLKATEATPETDADAEAEAQARKDAGATAEEVAQEQQTNDAPGASPGGHEAEGTA